MPLLGLESIQMVAVGHKEGDRTRVHRAHPILANEKAVNIQAMESNSSYALTLNVDSERVEYEFNEEQRLEGMCRVCASSDSMLIPVFDSAGESKGIVDLLNNHLPILVTPTDLLPVTVCTVCLDTLSSIHSLVEVCVQANEKMQQMLPLNIVGVTQLNNYEMSEVEFSEPSLQFDSAPDRDADHCTRQYNSSNLVESETTFAVPEQPPNSLLNKERKLYRCLHCEVTDSDAYSLLLHQIKSHPEKLLKCSNCDFVCSADQTSKYHEHLKFHSESIDSFSQLEIQSQNEELPLKKEHNANNGRIKNKDGNQQQDNISSRKRTCTDKKSSNSAKQMAKKEAHWRCGFCGMKAKSKVGLIDHCNMRHKERLGLSFLNSGSLECARCRETFESEVWLKDHLCHSVFLPKTIPTPKQLSCLTCPQVFTEVKLFREHLLSHTNSVKCHVCGAHFRSQSHLQPHLDKHKNKQTSFQCPHCPRNFKLRSRMKIHLRTHTGERPYMCVKCGKQFSTDSGFRLHMAAHEGIKPYVCAQCGQTFNRPSNLRRHESVCGDTKLQCRICKDKFSSREEMHCHRAMHSKEEKDAEQALFDDGTTSKIDRFSCKVCGMKFDRVVELSQHRQESHTAIEVEEAKKAGQIDGGAFVCPDCGKELYSKRNFERHMLLHSGNTQYHCKECANVYATKFALEYHMYTHTGERPFKCDICPAGFKTRISLKIHHMKHTGEKPYKCRICSMGFITAASLRLHLVTHSDTRMFSCSYCPATFKRKKTLVTHVRIHTGEKPYECKYCGRRFTQKGSCSQHEKTHSEPKSLRLSDGVPNGMEVTVVKNWRGQVSQTFPEEDANRINILVSQDDNNALQCEAVQDMVLIQQDVDCVIESDLMDISEDMLRSNKHAIIIEQDGILGDVPVTGLKDANSDPQMPVLDE
ncbi:Zinc finger and SCAN domain-containing protein 2 [Frankliniella fusca]|uniref:Zinc finger and SCAN domain-containing protein 2 n=1 Tax=Frankliniella fusca TaxID=407009 RepID=A0AAE1H3H6_9NEOP|nr:Zinc finger and SCAN domain-containing protein 2 [Frankliniella fusca]